MVDAWVAGGDEQEACTLRSEHPFAPPEATKQIDRRIDCVLVRPGGAQGKVDVRRAFTLHDPVDCLIHLTTTPPSSTSHSHP
jgi:hypothetical protein